MEEGRLFWVASSTADKEEKIGKFMAEFTVIQYNLLAIALEY